MLIIHYVNVDNQIEVSYCKELALIPNVIALKFKRVFEWLRLDNTSQGLHRATPVFWQYKIRYLSYIFEGNIIE